MSFVLYNSLQRKKIEFKPLAPPVVKMYLCGPTVYNFLHIGNFRGPVVFDFLKNYLEVEHGYQVESVLNFTDVDDRILNLAKAEKKTPVEISERYIAEYKIDYESLGLNKHKLNPKVTETIPEIIQFIAELIEQGFAYNEKGNVWFSVRKFSGYGKLSGRKIDDLESGHRDIELQEGKKDPLDFALWKKAADGEWSWDSPWSKGRPGWHIECSAMIQKYMGKTIDIHGGGTDLIFPHHENEIAQSEAHNHQEFSNFWMHIGMLQISGAKMSKSLGNFVTLREFLKTTHPEVYKWMMLSVHYRSLSDFSDQSASLATHSIAKIYSALAWAHEIIGTAAVPTAQESKEKLQFVAEVRRALADDLNTPEAFAALFEWTRIFNQKAPRVGAGKEKLVYAADYIDSMKWFSKIVPLFRENAAQFLQSLDDELLRNLKLSRTEIDGKISERNTARTQKDFQKSDQIRDELLLKGIQIYDSSQGTTREVKK